MGTVDLGTYIKQMQSLIFENGSTYSENFLSIEDNKQEKYVRELTKAYEEQRRTLDEVAKTKKTKKLDYMNPYERRIIHSALQNDKYVLTYSEGTDPHRRLVIEIGRAHV